MQKELNVLTLGVTGNVTQGMIQVLKKQKDVNVNILGACITEDSIGQYMTDGFVVSPYANDKNFIPWLIDICNSKNIDLVLTGVEENIAEISKNLERLKTETKSKFIVADEEQLKIGNDKYLTCKWLKENGCNYPLFASADNEKETENLVSEAGFPLIAKPKCGKGSRGVFVINKKEDLSLIDDKAEYVLEELLGTKEDEYTVATYTNKKGVFQSAIILKRYLQNGTTVLAETVENEKIFEECKKITEKFKIKGPLNIQLRMHKDKPVCFELNVRFSGTTPIRNLLGWRDLMAAIGEYVYNEDDLSSYFEYKKGKVYRVLTPFLVGG